MLQEINIIYPVALFPLTAASAFPVPPLRKATPEKSLRQQRDPGSTVCTSLLVFPRQPHQLLQLLEEIAVEIYLAADVQEAQQQLNRLDLVTQELRIRLPASRLPKQETGFERGLQW